MTDKRVYLLTIVLLLSSLTGIALAQPQLKVVQDPQEYYDGVLTSLTPLQPQDADVIFINGILTAPDAHQAALRTVANYFSGMNVMGIYNETSNNIVVDSLEGIDDLRQGLGLDRITTDPALSASPPVSTLLTYLLLYDQPITIVAHSQGAAIVSAALQEFVRRHPQWIQRLNYVTVITLGGFAVVFPPGPQYLHLVFSSDVVPVAAQKLSWILAPAAEAEARDRYNENTIMMYDGPAPLLKDIEMAGFVFPLPGIQHGLEDYLSFLGFLAKLSRA